MQFKAPLAIVTGIIAVLCAYYLSLTFISRGIEADAIEFATDSKGELNKAKKTAYLDSLWTEPVLNLGVTELTYKDIKSQEVKLGLDLKGGMNVTMEVSAADILRVLSENNPNPAFNKSIVEANKEKVSSNKPFVDLFYDKWKANANGLTLARIFSNKSNAQKINFNSSDEDVLKYIREEVNLTIDRSFEILRARIDKFGVTAPNIQRLQGTNRIQVELPGVDDPNRVRKLLQGAAKLEFFEVYEASEWSQFFNALNDKLAAEEKAGITTIATEAAAAAVPATPLAGAAQVDGTTNDTTALADTTKKADTTAKAAVNDTAKADTSTKGSKTLQRLFVSIQGADMFYVNTKDTSKVNTLFAREDIKALFPPTMVHLYSAKPFALEDGRQVVGMYFIKRSRDGKAPLDGSVITNAYPDFDPSNGEPNVGMTMNADGTRIWRKLTASNIKRKIAIVLDNLVYSAPTVQNEIPNGSSNISGSFTIEEAKDLANILKAGRMPVPTQIVEEVVVGPSLGADSINKGLNSIFVGLAFIVLFMIAYYAKSGLVANLAVLLNILLILGFLVQFDAVLTLPGIAGIVLTIGMAVDANVLINERIKEEIQEGAPLAVAVANGYKLASTSIWDANITTLIAGVVMIFFGSGPVQGFATTLVLGIFTSLLTSVYITRIITEWRLEKGDVMTFTTAFSANLFRNLQFDFVGKRKIAYVASSIVISLGIGSIALTGLNYGVDFKGGWSYIVSTNGSVDGEQLKDALAGPLGGAPEVKQYGSDERFKITTTYMIDDESETAADKVTAVVNEGLAKTNADAKIESSSKVGPTIARDIKSKSIYAVILAMMGIFAYIWLRFRNWSYGLGSTIAVIHDTAIIFTFYSIGKEFLPFSLEIDQNFIAAVLTIIGFSVNDNVVIFDRIREQLRDAGPGADKVKQINQALNYTFSRTIITASTVLVVVLILLLFGGESIRGLSFALLIGVLTGTYSTIYIAVPFLIDAEGKKQEGEALTPATA